jgi:phage terminase small subunit
MPMTSFPIVAETPADTAVEAVDEFGLTPKQRDFADQLLAGAPSPTEAARRTGCQGQYAMVYASRTLRSRAVQEYIRQSVGHTLAVGSVRAMNTMLNLLDNRSGQVQFWAARDLLDMGGHMAQPATPPQPTLVINIDLS